MYIPKARTAHLSVVEAEEEVAVGEASTDPVNRASESRWMRKASRGLSSGEAVSSKPSEEVVVVVAGKGALADEATSVVR